MGQLGIPAIVSEHTGYPVLSQRGSQIEGIVAQVVFPAGDQHTGWQRHSHRLMIRIHVGIEGMLLVLLAIEGFGHDHADAVLSRGIEH